MSCSSWGSAGDRVDGRIQPGAGRDDTHRGPQLVGFVGRESIGREHLVHDGMAAGREHSCDLAVGPVEIGDVNQDVFAPHQVDRSVVGGQILGDSDGEASQRGQVCLSGGVFGKFHVTRDGVDAQDIQSEP